MTCTVCGAPKDTDPQAFVCDQDSGVTMTAEELAELVKADIREGIKEGWLPDTVVTFDELHDHCDANTLGGMTDEDRPASHVWCTPTIVRMQDIVSAWLVARLIDGAE